MQGAEYKARVALILNIVSFVLGTIMLIIITVSIGLPILYITGYPGYYGHYYYSYYYCYYYTGYRSVTYTYYSYSRNNTFYDYDTTTYLNYTCS